MKEWLYPSRWAGSIKRQAYLLAVTAVILTGMFLWVFWPQPSVITVNGLAEPTTFRTTEKTVAAALKKQGISLGMKDRVTPPLETPISRHSQLVVKVEKALPVTVIVDGKHLQVETLSQTVGDLIKELSLKVSPEDKVSAEATARIQGGMSLKIVRRSEETRVAQVDIPFQTVKREDEDLDMGETREIQPGETGTKEVKTIVYLEDGKEVGSKIVEESVVKPAQDQIIAYGTVGVVSRGGMNYRYSQRLELSATGYTAGKESNPDGNGYTYTGMKAKRGVVAVDPRVIPLYSRLYIEGYGPAVAADIGAAIHGDRIDLCFDSLDEALEWGRRSVTVYILKN